MNEEKQIEKVSKSRQEYLKFKPFADDLRKAESWCELDGVLNRYQTVKNLSKMGYRKAPEIFEEIEERISALEYQANSPRKIVKFEELKAQVNWVLHEVVPQTIAELKKKYTEEGK